MAPSKSLFLWNKIFVTQAAWRNLFILKLARFIKHWTDEWKRAPFSKQTNFFRQSGHSYIVLTLSVKFSTIFFIFATFNLFSLILQRILTTDLRWKKIEAGPETRIYYLGLARKLGILSWERVTVGELRGVINLSLRFLTSNSWVLFSKGATESRKKRI